MRQDADRSASVFGNAISTRGYRSAQKSKQGYVRRFGDDSDMPHHLQIQPLPVIGQTLGVRNLAPAPADAAPFAFPTGSRPVVVGNIRMGFGHYRISMAIASAARALGYDPFWLDLMGFPESTCSKIVSRQNDLYSLGSRLSQQVGLFNKVVWEPLNTEGFRKLSYNASDQKNAELMAPVLADLPSDVPFVATHAWPAQAAVHAGLTRVVNAIPDNWPMALHLAEGAVHTVQTPSAYWGYRQLRGMDKDQVLQPMPGDALRCVGHYVDHELVEGIACDCEARRVRAAADEPVRYLLSVGGAGAQFGLFAGIIEHLMPEIEAGRAMLMINVGDHRKVWGKLLRKLPVLGHAECYFDDFARTQAFADVARTETVQGVHAFCHDDIFAAVYSTNVLMRVCDVLVTKPSELSFYPVPKLMISRVGGHEAWGAVRAAEVGDGTYEMGSLEEACATIDLLQADRTLVPFMCDRIEAAATAGVYNGAYRAVKLAVGDAI
ncbi:MAG: hypothetical protein J5804_06070 [Eggerthellaceae bacterium]|nr:hypothetical protein [Eggerthellaceae bacterium]